MIALDARLLANAAVAALLLAALAASAEPIAGDGTLDVLNPFYAERSGGPYDDGNGMTRHIVCDARRQRMVRFGGLGRAAGFPMTAEWDGQKWVPVPCDPVPPVQGGFQMAYDAARSNVVLFGGYPAWGETWLYDGGAWTNARPAHSPSARYGHDMVYDSSRQRVVLFGGTTGGTNVLSDTWEWDGADWHAMTSLTPPPQHGRVTRWPMTRPAA